MKLEDGLEILKGIGKKRSETLKKLGLYNIYDLITYYPKNYEDKSVITPISELRAGGKYTVIGEVLNVKAAYPRPNLSILTFTIFDGTGYLQVAFFNQNYLKKQLTPGKKIMATGAASYAYGGRGAFTMKSPSVEILDSENIAKDEKHDIEPIYRTRDNLTQKQIRRMIDEIFNQNIDEMIPDIISPDLEKKYNLMKRRDAFYNVHFPRSMEDVSRARRALAFEELYLIQCGLLAMKKNSKYDRLGRRHLKNGELFKKVKNSLPFSLTGDQEKAVETISLDMGKTEPMRRLLIGDVGSGKTVVAMLALVKTVENGYQGALMAPTEILATQHFESFKNSLEKFNIRIGLLTGKLTKKERELMYERMENHEVDIVIGTHALIQENVKFHSLGLVVTDEQHRFGIAQRAALEEQDITPDVLVMTATPIPRTLTLTVYGDLDLSVIKELPPGRKPIRTFLRTPERRGLIYNFVKGEIEKGRQAYVVCPLIEESENLDLPSAEEVYAELSRGIFKNISCGLIHGRMKEAEKDAIMQDFYAGKIKLLVATTVIEVGVNVPNASMMVIEHAERFGLSQLHQLRGRIGRGEYQSYCVMVANIKNETAKNRLEKMVEISDGFKLAEEDLKLRGPGEFFGSHQHGLGDLKIANALEDTDLLLKAREAALITMENEANFKTALNLLSFAYRDKFENILR